MSVIWKFVLPRGDAPVRSVHMPDGAKILHVAEQNRDICVWAYVEPHKPTVPRLFCVAGTGQNVGAECTPHRYIGTVHEGPFVWHVFEVTA